MQPALWCGGMGGGKPHWCSCHHHAPTTPHTAPHTPANRQPTLRYGGMGGGKLHWWSCNVMEGRELRFLDFLGRAIARGGAPEAATVSDAEAALAPGDAGALVPRDGLSAAAGEAPVQGWVPQKVMQASAGGSEGRRG